MNSLAAVATVFAVLFVPGLLTVYAAGLRGLAAWASAPAVTATLVGVGGGAAELVGIRWHVWVLALLTLAAVAVARLLRSRSGTAAAGQSGAVGAGLLVGAAFVVAGFARSIRSLSAVTAQPDASYHLNAIRWMLVHGDISSRDGGSFLYGRPHSFYPSTFHGIAATAGLIDHAQPVVLANALAIVAAGLVWVLGCLVLCRQALGRSPMILVYGGVGAGAFSAMPYLMAGYGPLWPYLVGLSLVPVLLTCVLALLRLGPGEAIDRPAAALVLVAGGVGLPLVHPQALAALILVGYVAVVARVVSRLASPPRRAAVVVRALLVICVPLIAWALVWAAVRHSPVWWAKVHYYAHGPGESVQQAVHQVLVGDAWAGKPLWVTSVLVVVGLVVCLRRSETRWLALAYVVLALVFVGVAAVESGLTQAITVTWYNDPIRLAALIPLAGVPILAAGLDALVELVRRWRAPWFPGLLTALYLVATLGNNQGSHVAALRPYYAPLDPTKALLTPAAATAFTRLARSIPPDAVVAGNPWRGHSLLYAFTSRRVLFYSEKALSTPDQVLLEQDLYLAGDPGHPDVCAAVRRTGTTYVLSGGRTELKVTGNRPNFLGVEDVPGQPGFTEVAHDDGYILWRITACGL